MSTTITVCDGATQIGGNKILLETDGRALFFDFGLCFSKYGEYYAEFLTPRTVRGIYDWAVLGLLPPIQGIYRDDLLPPPHLRGRMFPIGSRPPRRMEASAVLVSHAHADHIGCISYLRPDIPIVCGPMTAFVTKALQDSGKSGIESQYCYVTPRVLSDESGVIVSLRGQPAVQRPFKLTGSNDDLSDEALAYWSNKFTKTGTLESIPPKPCADVAGLRVCRYPVDHSIYGASAFAVETTDGWVVYSGDLRTHGKHGRQTWEFAEAVSRLKPLAFIVEGTHITTKTPVREETVLDNCLRKVREAGGRLVIADFGPRNVERLESFLRIARETGRLLVVTAKDALLLRAMHLVDSEVPDPAEDSMIQLYDEPRGKTEGWQKSVIEFMRGKITSPEDVRNSPGLYILCFSFYDVNDLAELAPDDGGVYIYSSSELYEEEQELDFERLGNWLQRFDFDLIGDPRDKESEERYHASGHITGPDLEKLVRIVNPKIIIPVHTNPASSYEWFRQSFAADFDLRFPKEMEEIPLR